jgi:xanthine dehydrogenase small subunit
MTQYLQLTINGQVIRSESTHPNTTLLQFLRSQGWVGTKEGCSEGDCGACSVAVRGEGGYQAINACITLLPMLHGREIWTSDGLARANGGVLHPVQQAMIEHGGSQCGYCTPGFVMSMFAEYYRAGDGFDEHALAGNLCRCTGYRPIREAGAGLGAVPANDLWQLALKQPLVAIDSLSYRGFYRPTTLTEVLELLKQQPNIRLVAGGTDVALEITTMFKEIPVLLSLEAIAELQVVIETDQHWELGAAVPLEQLHQQVGGRIALLEALWPWFASKQVRNRATLGGNLGTASPIGDASVVLLALDASVKLVSLGGERLVRLSEYFTGYRQTLKQPNEIIQSIIIPKEPGSWRTGLYKAAKRGYDDISSVMAAFAIELNDDQTIKSARLAYGGVAATPARASSVEAFLLAQAWNEPTVQEAAVLLRQAFTPLSDMRASAKYRQALIGNLFKQFYQQNTQNHEVQP